MEKILFIVDMQNGFLNNNSLFLVEKINMLLNSGFFDYVIASKFVNDSTTMFNKVLHWSGLSSFEQQRLSIDTKKINYTFEKSTYSAYNEEIKQLFTNKPFDKTIYLVGVDTDSCVLATAFSLFDNEITPIILKDCCYSTAGAKLHESAISIMQRSFGKENVIDSSSIVKG